MAATTLALLLSFGQPATPIEEVGTEVEPVPSSSESEPSTETSPGQPKDGEWRLRSGIGFAPALVYGSSPRFAASMEFVAWRTRWFGKFLFGGGPGLAYARFAPTRYSRGFSLVNVFGEIAMGSGRPDRYLLFGTVSLGTGIRFNPVFGAAVDRPPPPPTARVGVGFGGQGRVSRGWSVGVSARLEAETPFPYFVRLTPQVLATASYRISTKSSTSAAGPVVGKKDTGRTAQWQLMVGLGYCCATLAPGGSAHGPKLRLSGWKLIWKDAFVFGGGSSLSYARWGFLSESFATSLLGMSGDLVLGGGKRGRALAFSRVAMGLGFMTGHGPSETIERYFPRPSLGVGGQVWLTERITMGLTTDVFRNVFDQWALDGLLTFSHQFAAVPVMRRVR